MARTINEIHQSMMDAIAADDELNLKIYSTSTTSVYRLWTFIVATAIWMHETLFDELLAEITNLLNTQKTHNRIWYAEKAKAFQYGDTLVFEKDYYSPVTPEKQIVKQAAVDEINGVLFMKVAKEVGDELAPLSSSAPDEVTPFTEYIQAIKDAGVRINIISTNGDDLKLSMKIWYDAQVLDENGELLSNPGIEPAKDTIKNFIKNIPFNGEFIPADLVDALQSTSGIDIPQIQLVETRFGTNPFTEVDGKVVANAGYLVIDDAHLTLEYIPNVSS